MARPPKYNADYFPHDADMRNDIKVGLLRKRFTNDGYCFFSYMLELLTESDYFRHKWDEDTRTFLARSFDIEEERFNEIAEMAINDLKLFQIKDGMIFSKKLIERLEKALGRTIVPDELIN